MRLPWIILCFSVLAPPLAADSTSDEIVITPTRTATPRGEVGSSVSVIDRSEIERRSTSTLGELLHFTPGLDLRRSGGPGTLTSIFMRGTNSNHTKVLLDGIDVSDPSATGAIPQIEFLHTGGMGRVEVLRGPQSSLYGSDALGGVISVQTPRGTGAQTVAVESMFGSFDTSRSRFTAQAGDGAGHYFLHLGHAGTEGFSAKSNNTEDDAYRSTTVNTRFGFTPTEDFELDFFIHHIDSHNEFDGFTAPYTDETDADRSFYKVQPRWFLWDGAWISTLNLSYAEQKRDTVESGAATEFTGRTSEAGWQNDVQLGEKQLLTWGVAYREETGIKRDGSAFPTPFNADRDTVGFYVQDQIDLGGGRSLTPAVRWDDYSDFGTHGTYRVAGAWKQDPRRIWRASVGTGFNAPSYDQMFGFGGNPDLRPEESIGFDVGVEQAIGDRGTAVGVTGFYNDVDNLIASVSPSFTNFNFESALVRGGELFVVTQPAPGLEARVAYTYTDTRAGDVVGFSALAGGSGGRLLRRPLHKASLDLAMRWGEKATSTVEVIYVGHRDDAGGVRAEDYVVANWALEARLDRLITFVARVDNLFDVDHEDVIGFNAAPLSGYAGLRFEFK